MESKGGWKQNYPPQNILSMRNTKGLSFDEKIENVKPSEWPEGTRQIVYNTYCMLPASSHMEEIGFISYLDGLEEQKRVEYLTDILHIRYSTSTDTVGETQRIFQRTIHMDKSIYNHMLEANLMLLRLLLILKKLKH